MSPQEALSHALRAHQAGELSTAINHYEAVVLQLGEHNCPAAVLSNLAAVHLALDNSAAAERTWRVAIRVAPSHAESYCNLAIALQRAHAPQHQLREARDFALVAAALRPSYSKAYHALANVEQALGDEAGASRAWYNAEKYAEKQQKAVGTPAVGKLERVLRDMRGAVGSSIKLGGFVGQILAQQPRLVRVQQLLSAAECDALMSAALPKLAKSFVTGDATRRDSRTAWLPLLTNHSAAVAAVKIRVAKLLQIDAQELVRLAEDLQVVRYTEHGQFGIHHDAAAKFQKRVITVLIYLTEGPGGETWFPWADHAPQAQQTRDWQLNDWITAAHTEPQSAGLRVQPERGSAVIFSNLLHGEPDPQAVHAAWPSNHEKWVANVWLAER